VIIWVDAQLSPALAPWIEQEFGIVARSVKWLGLRDALDIEIFMAAREARAIVLSKDIDFVQLVAKHGPPPQILWVTAGNTSNQRIRTILQRNFAAALALLAAGERLVQLGDSGHA
jgi:predicted nuclease of predicted toxin-antitoxin system